MVIVMRARRTLAYPATRLTQNAPHRHTGSESTPKSVAQAPLGDLAIGELHNDHRCTVA